MKQQKYTDFQKAEANSLVNNIGGFTDPELWEDVKALHGGITRENHWTAWDDYWRALGEKGSERHGKFIPNPEYSELMRDSDLLVKLRSELNG